METLWSVQWEMKVLFPEPVIPITAIKTSLGCGWKLIGAAYSSILLTVRNRSHMSNTHRSQ